MVESLLSTTKAWFHNVEGALIAFSGGVDSALVLYLSKEYLGAKAVGVIADSPSLKRSDLQLAKQFCDDYGIRLRVIKTKELDNSDYASNPANRCFFCKDTLYETMTDLAEEYPGYLLLNGTNRDDHGDYRPGLLAAKEHQVHAPLSDCGLGKEEVRLLARHFKLPLWNKPASPCLSSRIPYGQAVSAEKLSQIEAAESYLAHLGFNEARVRHYGSEAKVEVPVKDLARLTEYEMEITDQLQQLGFESVVMDREGLVSGKLNRALVSHG